MLDWSIEASSKPIFHCILIAEMLNDPKSFVFLRKDVV